MGARRPNSLTLRHVDWSLPLEVYAEGLVTGHWPSLPVYERPADLDVLTGDELVLVSGFLRARESQLSSIRPMQPRAAAPFQRPVPGTTPHACPPSPEP
jgi:hypothetical protein